MSRGGAADSPAAPRFPRVSGDEPLTIANELLSAAFSPRERG